MVEETEGVRLQKVLAAAGIASRRASEIMIDKGRVEVNGKVVTEQGMRVDPERDKIRVDGSRIPPPRRHIHVVLNKPRGVVATMEDPEGRPTLSDYLPRTRERLFHVGRLDTETEGLIILTNDGQFNHRVTSPKHHVAKIYRVTLKHAAEQSLCDKLIKGVLLDDEHETIAAAAAELIDPNTLLMTLTQGKYHQVKRMIAAAGNRVEGLHRDQFHQWRVDDFAVGEWRFLDVAEVQASI